MAGFVDMAAVHDCPVILGLVQQLDPRYCPLCSLDYWMAHRSINTPSSSPNTLSSVYNIQTCRLWTLWAPIIGMYGISLVCEPTAVDARFSHLSPITRQTIRD